MYCMCKIEKIKLNSTEQSIWKNRVQYRASEEKTVQFRSFEENNTVDCRVQSISLKYMYSVAQNIW